MKGIKFKELLEKNNLLKLLLQSASKTITKKCNTLECPTVKNIINIYSNLRLVDKIENIVHQDNTIEWSANENSELLWTLLFCR